MQTQAQPKPSPQREHYNLTLIIPSAREMVSVVRATLVEVLRKSGFTPDEIEDVKLAVNEACANVIAHAYGWRRDGALILRVAIDPRRLVVRIRDFGEKASPESFKSRDLNDLQPSGVGIYLMKALMDEVRFDQSHPIGTELTLVKNRQEVYGPKCEGRQ